MAGSMFGSVDQVAVVAGDGGYAYFETENALGHIIEAIELPGSLPDPERTYPEQG